MYVCVCHGVTEKHIANAVDQGATRLKDLRHNLRVATNCGRCASCAKDCLKDSMESQQKTQTQKQIQQPLISIPLQPTAVFS